MLVKSRGTIGQGKVCRVIIRKNSPESKMSEKRDAARGRLRIPGRGEVWGVKVSSKRQSVHLQTINGNDPSVRGGYGGKAYIAEKKNRCEFERFTT